MDIKSMSLLRVCSVSEIRIAAPVANEHTAGLGPVELMNNWFDKCIIYV